MRRGACRRNADAATAEVAAFHSANLRWKFADFDVDKAVSPRLYSPHNGAPPAFRRDGAPAKLLTDSGDQTSDFGRMSWASAALRFTGEGDRHGSPGCLTSELEERETWTAESLRAASSIGEGYPLCERCGRTRLRRYTFLGTTLVVCVSNHARRLHVGPRQSECGGAQASLRAKRVIAEIKISVQLESLILAQSERWRQA